MQIKINKTSNGKDDKKPLLPKINIAKSVKNNAVPRGTTSHSDGSTAERKTEIIKEKVKPNQNIEAKHEGGYTAKDIYVLEGLEPVRRRPGMYIGSTGLSGLHHLI